MSWTSYDDYNLREDIGEILADVADEMGNQEEKWGVQEHPMVSPAPGCLLDEEHYERRANDWKAENDFRVKRGTLAWDGIVAEELYEALAETDPVLIEAELVQTAAVVCQMIAKIRRDRARAAE